MYNGIHPACLVLHAGTHTHTHVNGIHPACLVLHADAVYTYGIHTHINIHNAHTHTNTYIRTHTYMYTFSHSHTYIIHPSIHVYIHTCVHTYMCTYIHRHVTCTGIYICEHTCTQVVAQSAATCTWRHCRAGFAAWAKRFTGREGILLQRHYKHTHDQHKSFTPRIHVTISTHAHAYNSIINTHAHP